MFPIVRQPCVCKRKCSIILGFPSSEEQRLELRQTRFLPSVPLCYRLDVLNRPIRYGWRHEVKNRSRILNESDHFEVYQLCAWCLDQRASLATVACNGLIAIWTDQKHNGKDTECSILDARVRGAEIDTLYTFLI